MRNVTERTARGTGAGSGFTGSIAKTVSEWLSYSPADTVIVQMSGAYNEGGTAVALYIVPEQFSDCSGFLFFGKRRKTG